MKRPDKKSDEIAYRIWLRQQEVLLFQFQAKWFEVVLKERGSETSCSPVGVFEKSEREDERRKKVSTGFNYTTRSRRCNKIYCWIVP